MIPRQPLIAPDCGFLASQLGCWMQGNSLGPFSMTSTMQHGGICEDTRVLSTTLDVVEELVVWALEFRLQVKSGRGIHAQHAL
jgi:hypothetical protein